MYCPKCGAACSEGTRFCPVCGASLEAVSGGEKTQSLEQDVGFGQDTGFGQNTGFGQDYAPQPENTGTKPGLKLSPKVLKLAGIAAAVVIVLVIAVKVVGGLSGGGGGNYGKVSKDCISAMYDSDEREYVIYAGTRELGRLETYGQATFSTDLSVMANLDSSGTLYVISAQKGIAEVDEDVRSFVMSADGSAVAYISEDYDVVWYDVAKDSTTDLETGDDGARLGGFSPDGSALAFALYSDDEWEGFTVQKGKKAESLGDDMIPVAVSNKGTYIYYIKLKDSYSTGTFYVKHGKDENKLATDFSVNNGLYLNKDGSQVLFNDNDNAYLSVRGGEKNKIFTSSAYAIVAPSYAACTFNCGALYVYNLSDLNGHTYYTGSGIYYLNSKGESSKLLSDYSYLDISSNGKSLIYLRRGELKKISDVSKGDVTDLTDGAEAVSFCAAADCSGVFFYNEDDELYYQKGTGKAVKVGEDVYNYFMAPDGKTCYIVSDEVLYTSTGKSMAAVRDMDEVEGGQDKKGCFFAQSRGKDSYDIYLYLASDSALRLLTEDFEGYWVS